MLWKLHKGGSCSFAPASDVIILYDRGASEPPKILRQKAKNNHEGDYNEPPKRKLWIQNRDMYQ